MSKKQSDFITACLVILNVFMGIALFLVNPLIIVLLVVSAIVTICCKLIL